MNTRSPSSALRRTILAASIAAYIAPAMEAQTNQTWLPAGPDDLWNLTSLNWDAGATWMQNNNAIFGGTADTISVTVPITFNDLTFNSTGYTISAGAGDLTLGNDIASTITVTNAGETATINETIANNGATASSLTKAGLGTLVLGAANTYTGGTTISGGILAISNAGALASGNVALGNNTTLQINTNSTLTLTNANTISVDSGNSALINLVSTAAGALSFGSGTITVDGTLRVTRTATGVGAVNFTGALAGEGTLEVGNTQSGTAPGASQGRFNITNPSAYTAFNGSIRVLDGGNLTLFNGTLVNSNNVTIDSGGYLSLLGNSTTLIGALNGGGTITRNSGSSTTATVSVASGAFSGVISQSLLGGVGTVALTKTSAGTLTLSGASTYTGATTVNGGTLKAGVSASAFGSNSAVTLANTAGVTLDITGFDNSIGSLTGGGLTGGNVTLGAATLTVGGDGTSPAAFAGALNGIGGSLIKVGAGTLTLSGANTYTGSTTLTLGTLAFASGSLDTTTGISMNGGTLRWDGVNTQDLSSKIGMVTAKTATFDTNGNDVIFASGVGGGTTGALTKIGTGKLTLTASNSYNGATNVNGGTLEVATGGAITTTGAITIGTGATGAVLVSGGSFTASTGNLVLGAGFAANYTQTSGTFSHTGSTGFFMANAVGGVTTVDISGGSFTDSSTAVLATRDTTTLTISGANTSVSLGALSLGVSGGVASISTTNLLNAGTLTLTTGGITRVNGTHTINLNGGTLKAGSASGFVWNSLAGVTAVVGNSGITLDTNGNSMSIGQALTVGAGTGGLTKTSSGTLTLSGTNTYTGATTISAGTLSVGVSANLGGAASNLIFDGGTLQITGTALTNFSTIGHTVSFTAAKAVGLDINNAAHNFTVDQVLDQTTGGFTKLGAGTATLTQANTYTGLTSVTAGKLAEGATGSIADTSVLTVNGATAIFDLGASHNDTVATVTLDGAGSITGTSGSTLTSTGSFEMKSGSVSAILAGDGIALNKTTSGTVTLSGTNTYTGATTVSAGTLSVGASANLGGSASNLIFDGGTLQITGTALANFSTIGHTVSFAADKMVGLDINNTAHTFTVDQALNQGTGGFTKLGTGRAILSQANSYTGATTVSAGGLILTGANATTSVAVGANSFSQNGANALVSGTPITATTGNIILGDGQTSNANVTFSGGGGTRGALVVGNNANWAGTLTVVSTMTNGVNINPGLNATISGNIVNNGGNGTPSTGLVVRNDLGTFAPFGASTAGATLTISGIISGSGGFQTGVASTASTTTLTGINTFTGDINLTNGASQLIIGGAGSLGSGSYAGAISNGGTFRYNSTANQTLSGIISAGGALIKDNISTLTLEGANTYTGATTVAGGTLNTGSNERIANTVTLNVTGGTFDLQGFTETIGQITTLTNGTISGTTGNQLILSAAANTTTATGSNTISANLQLNTGTALARTFSLTGASDTLTISGAISEGTTAGSLTKSGAGTLILSGTNIYTGNTTVNAGTLRGTQASGTPFGTGVVSITNSTLALAPTGSPTNVNLTGSTATSGNPFTYGTGATLSLDKGSQTSLTYTQGGVGSALSRGTNGTLIISVGAIANLGNTVAGGGERFLFGGTVTPVNNLVSGVVAQDRGNSNAGDFVTYGANGFAAATYPSTINVTGGTTTFTSAAGKVISGTSLTKTGAGTFVLAGATANTYTGGTFVNTGTFQLGANNLLADAGAVTVGGGTFDINSRTDTVGAVKLTIGSITGTSGVLTGSSYAVESGSIGAILAGTSVALTKTTGGTVTLSGANTYTGPTKVTGGTLSVSGSLSGTMSAEVNSGGTLLLSGTGLYTNKANTGASVALGTTSTGGTLALANDGTNTSATQSSQDFTNLTLSNTSTLDFGSNLLGNGNILRFTGTTTQSSFLSLIITNWSGSAYALGVASDPGTDLTQDRLLFASNPGFGPLGTEISTISFFNDRGDFIGHGMGVSFAGGVEILAVPEPSSPALLSAVGLLGLVGGRERRRRRREEAIRFQEAQARQRGSFTA